MKIEFRLQKMQYRLLRTVAAGPNNLDLNAHYALVTFSGTKTDSNEQPYDDAWIVQGWGTSV
jgi:hypothetical protein